MNIYDPTSEEVAEYEAWLEGRPDAIKAIASRFKPWEVYRLEPPGQNVLAYSVSEDLTMMVDVLAELNPGMYYSRQVFGIDPDTVKPIDEPSEWLKAAVARLQERLK